MAGRLFRFSIEVRLAQIFPSRTCHQLHIRTTVELQVFSQPRAFPGRRLNGNRAAVPSHALRSKERAKPMMSAYVHDGHVATQQLFDKLPLHRFELAVKQFLVHRALLRQPPHAKRQAQGSSHAGENSPQTVRQRDVLPPRGAGEKSRNSL
jgi:hypothetical protein